MAKIAVNNISTLSVGEVVSTLSSAYIHYIKEGLKFKNFPSVMLWSSPGTGKSESVREIADNITQATGKKTVVTDVRLLLFNPIDLRGIPVANEDRTLAIWLKPKIFQMDPSEDVVNILFLDEISAAPQSIQAAAYQITLDRIVGEHALPDNCIVIAAGNRVTDKSVAYKMPKALANRLLHLEVSTSFESWRDYAIAKGVNEKVLGFLNYKPNCLNTFDPSNDSLAFATPRSWMMVSNILETVSDDVDKVYPLISGLISSGLAIEFRTWCKVFRKLPTYKDVFEGRVKSIPDTTDKMYALVSTITVHAHEYINDLEAIRNAIKLAKLLPADFSTLLLRNFLTISDDFKKQMLSIPEFMDWVNSRGSSLNGII